VVKIAGSFWELGPLGFSPFLPIFAGAGPEKIKPLRNKSFRPISRFLHFGRRISMKKSPRIAVVNVGFLLPPQE
jgi:hypothetical protein